MADLLSAAQEERAMAADHGRFNRIFFVLALLPMALVAAIINRYGVNVPYGDEWSTLSLFGKWDMHQLTVADLYREHNGHRILVPRLFYLALTQLTRGNVRVEMFFSLFLCILTSAGIYLLLRRTVTGSASRHLALWAFINLFLFSPIQAENWLWGFQLQIFLANLCLVGAIVSVASEASVLVRFTGAAIFGVAGTFSFGNGLLIWLVVLLMMVCRREGISFLVAWIGAAVLVMLAYLPGYLGHEAGRPVIHWKDYLVYFAGFLGAPLARIPNSQPLTLPVIIGVTLVAVYLGIAFHLARRCDVQRNAAPWLALGAYAFGSAIMAAIARTHFGPEHALDSRYTTVSIILVVSLIGLVAVVRSQVRKSALLLSQNTTLISLVLIGALLFFYAINVPSELTYLRLHYGFRARGKAALEFSAVLDLDRMIRSNLLIREDPETLARYLDVLDRLKLAHPARRRTLSLDDAEERSKRSTDEYGVFEKLGFESPDVLVASGWSYLPGDGRAPACVVLAYRSELEWKAFALSERAGRRPDSVDRRWACSFSRNVLSPGVQEISAWAFDANRGRTYRLPGSFRLLK